jgi:hypothetical protein
MDGKCNFGRVSSKRRTWIMLFVCFVFLYWVNLVYFLIILYLVSEYLPPFFRSLKPLKYSSHQTCSLITQINVSLPSVCFATTEREITVFAWWLHLRHVRRIAKATISFFMFPVHLSVWLSMEQLGSHWTHFHKIWYLTIYRKICLENSSIIKIWQE